MSDLLAPGQAGVRRELTGPGTLVVLDFDGTLAPIVRDRRAARLPAPTRRILDRLALSFPVAVLSGRAADDVAARLGGAPVRWIIGSHGAEWPGEEGRHRAWQRLVGRWELALRRRLAGVAGVELEVKPLSLAIHFRAAPEPDVAERLVARAARGLGATTIAGKRVLNLVPPGAGDKGTALARLVEAARPARVLFVGDDVTDEAAFAARLPVPAVMVRVGRAPHSRARYFLRRRADVDRLLAGLAGRSSAGEARRRPA